MKCINEGIRNIPPSRVALVSSEAQYSYEDINNLKILNEKILMKLRGASLVINGKERLEFILLLSILDGEADKILFLPMDIDKKLHKEYYNSIEINYEVYLEDNFVKYRTIQTLKLDKIDRERYFKTKWIIPTSGTTSVPKLVTHTFKSLTRSTKLNIELGKNYRWGLVFDIYRFSGIQVFLQAMLSGATLIICKPEDTTSQVLTFLVDKKCNALSSTPSFWRKVLMSKESNDLGLKRITLGGEIADQNILHALKKKYPESKISHIYASTEVGVGFSVTDGEEGFPRRYLDGALDNIKMKIDDDGLLWISPNNKSQKYFSDEKMYDSEGYINTGDIVVFKNDRVCFLGRSSGAINVGGNKVQPEEVEAILLNSGLLRASYVYAIDNPMMGSLVCADVVLMDDKLDKKEIKKKILNFCRENLESFKVPAIVKFVNELKITQSGKLKREIK